jgi:hypothetical protein
LHEPWTESQGEKLNSAKAKFVLAANPDIRGNSGALFGLTARIFQTRI